MDGSTGALLEGLDHRPLLTNEAANKLVRELHIDGRDAG